MVCKKCEKELIEKRADKKLVKALRSFVKERDKRLNIIYYEDLKVKNASFNKKKREEKIIWKQFLKDIKPFKEEYIKLTGKKSSLYSNNSWLK